MSRLALLPVLALVACFDSSSKSRIETEPTGDSSGCSDVGIPSDYACKVNPLAGKAMAVSAGQTLYEENCQACHGTSARGDGDDASMYTPRPTNLIETMAQKADDYLLWRISNGGNGNPVVSDMPSWLDRGFTREQIWQLIAYVRSLPTTTP